MSIPKKGKVAMLTDIRKIEVLEFDIPAIGDDEILLKVEGCGVCGTDAHEYKGDPFALRPVVLGHEGTGEVVAIGKNITHDFVNKPVKVGDKLITCIIPCGECHACKTTPARTNLCEKVGIYGLIPEDKYHFNGYFGEYVIIRKGSTFFNVSDLDLDSRLLVEPFAVAMHALERAKTTGLLRFDSKVLIQGCGPIGLCVLSVVRAMGIEEIIVVDGSASRLELAKELGATHLINISDYKTAEEEIEAVKAVSDGLGAQFAFQCTGVPKAAALMWRLVRRGGGLCEVGFFVDNGECTINPHLDLCNKEITAVGSWVYTPEEYPATFAFMKLAKSIKLPIHKLITHRFPLDQMNEAMETNIRMDGIKVCFVAN